MKLNKTIYTNSLVFFKRRFIELFGLLLITIFILFSYSLINYSPKNPTLIYNLDTKEVTTNFNFYLNIVADFFLQSFGLVSFLLSTTVLCWGINLIIGKKIQNILSKTFYTIIYLTL